MFLHQVLSDLKRRQAEKLEWLLNQNEEKLARVERENQVLEKQTLPNFLPNYDQSLLKS